MATARYTYELETLPLCGQIAVHRLRGDTHRARIAVFMRFKDAVDFKRMKEAQGEAASVRNKRRYNREPHNDATGNVPNDAPPMAALDDGSTLG